MKIQPKDILKPTIVLFLICLVVTGGLAATNIATKDQIIKINKQTTMETQKKAFPDADTFKEGKDETYVVAEKSGSTCGYVFTTNAKSYGGDIKVLTGIDNDGKITGVELLSTSDTPGLGLNAQKQEFRDQYKKQSPSDGFKVIKSGESSDNTINALTGATITSNAMTSAVNDAVEKFNQVKGGA